jgi:hypothetical protein
MWIILKILYKMYVIYLIMLSMLLIHQLQYLDIIIGLKIYITLRRIIDWFYLNLRLIRIQRLNMFISPNL